MTANTYKCAVNVHLNKVQKANAARKRGRKHPPDDLRRPIVNRRRLLIGGCRRPIINGHRIP